MRKDALKRKSESKDGQDFMAAFQKHGFSDLYDVKFQTESARELSIRLNSQSEQKTPTKRRKVDDDSVNPGYMSSRLIEIMGKVSFFSLSTRSGRHLHLVSVSFIMELLLLLGPGFCA